MNLYIYSMVLNKKDTIQQKINALNLGFRKHYPFKIEKMCLVNHFIITYLKPISAKNKDMVNAHNL